MANPNIVNVTDIRGKTTGLVLSNTNPLMVLNNPVDSGKLLKINTLNVANYSPNVVVVSVSIYSSASLGGSSFDIAGNISIPNNGTLNIIDKSTQYYIEENQSIGARATLSNCLVITTSYEEIS